MEDVAYSGTKGGLCGCLAAIVFAAVLAFPLLFVWAWSGSHCEPVPQCQRFAEKMLLIELAAVAGLAALLAFSVRTIFNWWMTRKMGGAVNVRPPIWAVGTATILLLVGVVFVTATSW